MRVGVAFTAGALSAPGAWIVPPGFPRDLERWTAVVVDILRATTTLTVALSRGARGVEPLADPGLAVARRAAAPDVLACGEREGRIVPGFDLGNSPFEYTSERVAGRTLAFASTNGSRALLATAPCRRRLLGAFVNASAVRDAVVADAADAVLIVCAGQLGSFSLEDAAFAGWLCARLAERGAVLAGAEARLARSLAPRDAAEVRAAVEGSSHGRALRRLGPDTARDVAYCAGLDTIGTAFSV